MPAWVRFLLISSLVLPAGCVNSAPALRLATTTSVEDSGLMDHLGTIYWKKTGIRLDVVAVGSGKALSLLERGDVTCAITHAPDAEIALTRRIAARRREVFSNRFVIVGPPKADLVEGPFASRGDGSGTHHRELKLWKERGSRPRAYVETGRGMAHTLDYSFEKGALTLTDTSTLASYAKRDHLVIHEIIGRNVYSILARPADPVALRFYNWLISGEGREAVESYRKGGERLFEGV